MGIILLRKVVVTLFLVLLLTLLMTNISSDWTLSPDSCRATKKLQNIFIQDPSRYRDPGKHVVEEFLEYTLVNRELCTVTNPEEDNLVVILVDTARSHFQERQLIRETWASIKRYGDWRVTPLFLMGQSDYCEGLGNHTVEEVDQEERSLMEEHTLHGDTLFGSFADTYRNLTYKHLMGYKFVVEDCPSAKLIIKTDDDMFVNVPKILHFRTQELWNATSANTSKLYDVYCHNFQDKPTRCRNCLNGKWFSTLEEWPEEKYPLYCLGNDYVISRDWVERIYSVRQLGGFFWVDDVFIMGKLRQIAEKEYNVTSRLFNIRSNMTDKRKMPGYYLQNCANDTVDFGFFAFLARNWKNFTLIQECLWNKAVNEAEIV